MNNSYRSPVIVELQTIVSREHFAQNTLSSKQPIVENKSASIEIYFSFLLLIIHERNCLNERRNHTANDLLTSRRYSSIIIRQTRAFLSFRFVVLTFLKITSLARHRDSFLSHVSVEKSFFFSFFFFSLGDGLLLC